ncbi:MAG: hypothetical protein AAF298_17540 [Cyanobacteria bacterium P01_A01_bin.40]
MNKDNQQTERPTFTKFKEKALENSEVKKEYETLTPTYQLKKNTTCSQETINSLSTISKIDPSQRTQ